MSHKEVIIGAGCFWGVEALFMKLEGVISTTSGYCGGSLEDPTYEDICKGNTGHAEVVKVEFDDEIVKLKDVLFYFFRLHDPTTVNSQGVDIGEQYRSIIFYSNDEEKNIALDLIKELNEKHFEGKIVTQVEPSSTFYPAEDYHQKYYMKKYEGGNGPICHFLRVL